MDKRASMAMIKVTLSMDKNKLFDILEYRLTFYPLTSNLSIDVLLSTDNYYPLMNKNYQLTKFYFRTVLKLNL